MAIYSAVPPPPELGGDESNNHLHGNAQQQHQQHEETHVATAAPGTSSLPTIANGVDIAAWTISALESLTVSPVALGTGTPLSIPLDETKSEKEKPSVSIYDARARYSAVTPPPRPSSRRDSMKRREALLKGNEGSRQRRRWENGKKRLFVTLPVLPPFFSFLSSHAYSTFLIWYREIDCS
jgi:hypothetical protein